MPGRVACVITKTINCYFSSRFQTPMPTPSNLKRTYPQSDHVSQTKCCPPSTSQKFVWPSASKGLYSNSSLSNSVNWTHAPTSRASLALSIKKSWSSSNAASTTPHIPTLTSIASRGLSINCLWGNTADPLMQIWQGIVHHKMFMCGALAWSADSWRWRGPWSKGTSTGSVVAQQSHYLV